MKMYNVDLADTLLASALSVGVGVAVPVRRIHIYEPLVGAEQLLETGNGLADWKRWNFVLTGDVDCNVCRAFTLRAERFHGEEWGAVPRFVGLGGDVLKIVVTPKTGTNTKWRASLDLILR